MKLRGNFFEHLNFLEEEISANEADKVWTDEGISTLIGFYQENPVLWNYN